MRVDRVTYPIEENCTHTAHAPMSSATLGAGSIAGRWRELQGSESWDGLLDPIDADLRASLIAYGELAGAAYGGLNSEKRSSHAGQCLYSPEYLLSATGVSHPEYYTVTKFLYATCDLGSVPFLAWPVAKAFFVQPVVKVVDPVAPQQQAVEPEPEPWWKKCWEWLEWWKWVKTDWIGYVAVATDEGAAALGRRDIVVAWRGTMEGLEMIKDIVFMGMSAGPLLGPRSASVHRRFRCTKVHGGFLSVYTAEPKPEDFKRKDPDDNEIKTSAREQALDEVRRLMVVHKDEVTSITVTGHSLGASLATLNAVDMVANGVNVAPGSSRQPPCPVTAILFACPKVGNCRFKAAFASFPGLRALHVKNDPDVIPRMPPLYADVATVTLHVDTRKSPHLRVCNVKPLNPVADLFTYHNLECYLHAVAGYRGAADGVGFELVVHRDVALVNKSADALVDTYEVPANWWVVSNKFMVKQPDGHWELDDHQKKKQSSDDGQNDNAGA